MKRFAFWSLLVIVGAMIVWTAGCSALKPNTEPLERTANVVITEVVRPMVQSAATQVSARTMTGQGGAMAVEPGWRMEITGKVVQGFEGIVEIRAKGVAGQVTAHVQADNEAEKAPDQKVE